MIPPVERAALCFQEGCNCAQSVFSAFSPAYGIDEDLARRLASGFGGGIARQGEVCGAVSGAVLALSLALGYTKADQTDAKALTYQQVQAFLQRFFAQNGGLRCAELLGAGAGTPEWQAASRKRCPGIVASAAQILNELLEE